MSERKPCDAVGACVGIPVHDHTRTVGEVVRGAKSHASTVLVCDDGSTDGSGEAARAAGAEVLTLPKNRGKGAALQRLIDEAVARGFKTIICLDADGQHHPSDLPAVAAEVGAHPGELICGARNLSLAG